MTTTTSTARHLLVRLAEPARLPDALLGSLRDEVVLAGWVRASGILADVELRVYDARLGAPGAPRRLEGPVHALLIEGSVGLANGDVTCGLRAVLTRETDTGIQTLAGEITSARVVALEAIVTALDDIAAARSQDKSGVWLIEAGSSAAAPRPAAAAPAPAPSAPAVAPAPAPPAAQPTAWVEAARASEAPPPAPAPAPAPAKPFTPGPRPSPTFQAVPMPQRPVKVVKEEEDQIYPDAGDTAEHFAFGRCEVLKSDGDRLHVRLGKDGRIKEIALDMLKVSPLPPAEGQTTRHFKLDRKL